jgi:hypothetical protein
MEMLFAQRPPIGDREGVVVAAVNVNIVAVAGWPDLATNGGDEHIWLTADGGVGKPQHIVCPVEIHPMYLAHARRNDTPDTTAPRGHLDRSRPGRPRDHRRRARP